VDGMSYDLGANYLTWEYQETLAIAREVGATTYSEKPYTSIDVAPDRKSFRYRSLFEAVLDNTSLWSFVLAAVRYLAIRSRLRDVIDIPDYLDRIHEHPELCVSFKDWLAAHRLMPLATLFQFPITIMGYGQLDEIAAPYALRYMSVRTFLPMVFGRPPVSWIVGNWPRRFDDGFQRLWERVAWRTNVRLNVDVKQVDRSPEGIRITMEYPEQHLNEMKTVKITDQYDYLVLACPLTPDVFHSLGLSPNTREQTISEAIHVNPYCMTTFWVDKMEMPEPIAPILPLPERGTPLAVARQFQDNGNMFTQFYTQPRSGQRDKQVIDEVKSLITLLGGVIDESRARWHTFDEFSYFQHFTPD
jgi:Flavin containing amine oxidoreductase